MKRRRKKRSGIHIFSKFILSLNILAVLALLLSYLASYVDPGKFWVISFFGLAYPAILIINILFVVYWLLRMPKLALISGLTIIAGWSVILNYIGFRESTAIMVPKSSESFIRIMSYNVHNFKQFGDNNDRLTKEQILDIIRKEQPDVVCFQEFFSRKRGEYNFRKHITQILGTEYYYFKPSTDNGYEAIGMAIFSKFPIVNQGNIEFTKNMNWNEAVFADIRKGNKIFRVYNVHFQSVSFQPEDYLYLKKITSEMMKTDVESSKKIGSRLKQAFIKRSNQVKMVKEHAEKSPIPHIIAGDFNDTPISYTVKTISRDMKNCFRKKGSGFGITYNGAFPNFQIDYIFTSSEFEVKNYLVINKKLSDHYPVRADLELK
ncbi:MAG: endonuclease/exonuclease/phosphatase family protein [Pedobacter sp.]|jgi:endonuclease/exonuclease/phosphatase family metal-dependent hydrolase